MTYQLLSKKFFAVVAIVMMTMTMTTVFTVPAKAQVAVDEFDVVDPAGGDRYYALGEDGTHICMCSTTGKKCVCQ